MKFRDMLIDYRKFEKVPSAFWIDFVARHFSGRVNERRAKLDKYWTLRYPANWLVYHNGDILFVALVVWCSSLLFCVGAVPQRGSRYCRGDRFMV